MTQFRLEAFNAFNRVNLGLPDATIFNAGGVRNPTAGRITRTSTPARQVQLGVKLSFLKQFCSVADATGLLPLAGGS